MKTDQSERISILRFPLILAVVYIHASPVNVTMGGIVSGPADISGIADSLQKFILRLAGVAVPLFYLLSGYLFFSGEMFDRSVYVSKLKSRARSLLIPFLFWNCFVIGCYWVIQNLSYTREMLSGKSKLIADYGLFDFANAMIGLTKMPIAYQFWFIRDLMMVVVISPLIYVAIKTANIAFIGLLIALYMFEYWPVYVPALLPVLFFSIGAYLQIHKKGLFHYDKYCVHLIFAFLLFITAGLIYDGMVFSVYINKISIFIGSAAVLAVTHILHQTHNIKRALLSLSAYSFFVFALHEPLLTFIKKSLFKVFVPTGSFAVTSIYFLSPVITVLFSLFSFYFLMKLSPKLASTITGGR